MRATVDCLNNSDSAHCVNMANWQAVHRLHITYAHLHKGGSDVCQHLYKAQHVDEAVTTHQNCLAVHDCTNARKCPQGIALPHQRSIA